MAAELHQLISTHQTNGGYIPPLITSLEAPKSSAAVSIGVSARSKRLRRPSVRFGEIDGDQHHVAYDSHSQQPKWSPIINRKELNESGKSSSRARTVTNLSFGYENTEEDRSPSGLGGSTNGSNHQTPIQQQQRNDLDRITEMEEDREEGLMAFTLKDEGPHEKKDQSREGIKL